METKRTSSSLLVSLLALSFLVRAFAQAIELKYDDGEFDYGWSDLYPLGAAARFSPPTSDWRIDEIRFYGFSQLKGSPRYFYVELWDQNLRSARQMTGKCMVCQSLDPNPWVTSHGDLSGAGRLSRAYRGYRCLGDSTTGCRPVCRSDFKETDQMRFCHTSETVAEQLESCSQTLDEQRRRPSRFRLWSGPS